jgi:peptidyl-prolyl cis-trans isomerase SurA
MNKLLLIILINFISLTSESKILDMVAGVINDKTFTLSEIKRISKTLDSRIEIAPFIFDQKEYTDKDILKVLQRIYIVKDKLSELGFVVSDDSVESRIVETEKRLGLRRDELLKFLETKGLTFNEYFELIRNATEFNIFNSRIILPLVNITEQEIKNEYYKLNSSNKALSFRYNLVDFFIAENKVDKTDLGRLPYIFEEYQKTGNLPEIYKSLDTNLLDDVSDDDLPPDLSSILKQTNEGAFSKTYTKNNIVHVFYIKKKDLTESQDYMKMKDFIYNKIYSNRSQTINQTWFSKESLNYYILENI